LKFLPDANSDVDSAACASAGFDTELVGRAFSGFRTSNFGEPDAVDATKMVFNGGVSTNTITLGRAGIVAVCYCRLSDCAESTTDWAFALRLTVRGPLRNQQWTVSTGVPFRLEFLGQGLRTTDTLRIIPPTKTCDTDNLNPLSEISVRVGCPLNCQEVDITTGMALALKLLDYQSVGCDYANANCRTVYVRRVTVRSATATELEFDSPPGLQDGDTITLGPAVQCQSQCTAEQLAAITGVYHFGDAGTHDVPNKVVATPDRNRFILPIGWSGTVPKFSVAALQGEWYRTSKASTAEELKGSEQKRLAKICWSYAGNGHYVEQVGTLDVNLPEPLAVKLSLTATAKDTIAPLVISFTTGVHDEYADSANPMMLKVVFLDATKLEPLYADEDALHSVTSADHSDASQNMCGKLFPELWSDDALGFPVPSGCYHNSLMSTQELYILFDARNGLRSSKKYQMVMKAVAKVALDTQEGMVQVTSMDDTVLRPYQVVERNQAAVSQVVQLPASGSAPQFMDVHGVEVLGGFNEVVEMGERLDLRFQLSGDTAGPIVKQTVLRLFFFPLTAMGPVVPRRLVRVHGDLHALGEHGVRFHELRHRARRRCRAEQHRQNCFADRHGRYHRERQARGEDHGPRHAQRRILPQPFRCAAGDGGRGAARLHGVLRLPGVETPERSLGGGRAGHPRRRWERAAFPGRRPECLARALCVGGDAVRSE